MFKRVPLLALAAMVASANAAQPASESAAPSSKTSAPVPREVLAPAASAGVSEAGGEIVVTGSRLARYVGRYALNGTIATVTLTKDGRLTVALTGRPKGPPLRAVGRNEFVADEAGVRLFFEGDGPRASRIRSRYAGNEVSGPRIADDDTTLPELQ
jgi:hypothetical protein